MLQVQKQVQKRTPRRARIPQSHRSFQSGVQIVLFYGTLYTLFMWIYHAASLHWVYQVLDWSKPLAIGLYLLNPLFLFLAYLFW